jgi:hypothetical protein
MLNIHVIPVQVGGESPSYEGMDIAGQAWFDNKRTPGDVALDGNTGAGGNKYPPALINE